MQVVVKPNSVFRATGLISGTTAAYSILCRQFQLLGLLLREQRSSAIRRAAGCSRFGARRTILALLLDQAKRWRNRTVRAELSHASCAIMYLVSQPAA